MLGIDAIQRVVLSESYAALILLVKASLPSLRAQVLDTHCSVHLGSNRAWVSSHRSRLETFERNLASEAWTDIVFRRASSRVRLRRDSERVCALCSSKVLYIILWSLVVSRLFSGHSGEVKSFRPIVVLRGFLGIQGSSRRHLIRTK